MRRTALLQSASTRLLALLLLVCCASAGAADIARFDNFKDRQGIPMQLKQVAPDLWFLYDDLSSNSAFLVTDDGVLVIDSRQHPQHGRELIQMIRKVTDKPIRWVVNTHAHGDHYYGNPAFREIGATIIAHRDTVAGMVKNDKLEFARRQSFFKSQMLDPTEVKTVLPDLVFDSTLRLRMGTRTVDILYWGPGQNPGDTLIHFPHARAVYVGGPFARKNWSNMSFTPSVDAWIGLLKRIAAMDVDLFLPGHGDVGNREDVLDEGRLLADVQAGVKQAIANGMTREQMVKELRFAKYADLRNYDRINVFIEALHHLYTTGKPLFPYP
ncbi:MAG: MBL fold metallo-hydrolase [Proteobacteria bacterium]|nr:MBL fold metallo-hydrolase [Burkholderiales bacterium]